jgi:hypothetical protein
MPPRKLYLRLRWPGINDDTERRTAPLRDGLARAVYAVTQKSADRVEVVIHTGEQAQELLMAADDRTLEANFELIMYAQETLPQTIGFELVDVADVGTTPALTVGLLGPTQTEQTASVTPAAASLRQYLDALIDQQLPHVLQIVVRTDGADCLVSLRAALYDRRVQWITDADYAAALADGTLDPATYFDDDDITSTWQVPLEGTWTVSDSAPIVGTSGPAPRLHLDADAIRELTSGTPHQPATRRNCARTPQAFDAIRNGGPSESRCRRLQSVGVDPWLSVDSETLPAFLAHVPAYYDTDPWPSVSGWGRFDCSVRSVLREAPGTAPGTTDSWTPPTVGPLDRIDIDEPIDPLVRDAARWFATRGYLRRAQTFPHAAFEVVRYGQPHPVAVITDDTIKPGDLIALVSAAARTETTAYLIADTAATANQIAAILGHPFQQTTADRTRLYATTHRLEADGQWCVHPRSLAAPEWWLTPDGILELWADNTCLARRSQTPEWATLIESLPRCRRVDGTYVVRDASGEQLACPSTVKRLNESFASLPAPATPAFLTSGNYYGTLLTPTDRGFKEYHWRPDWFESDTPGSRECWFTRALINRFSEHYTVAAPEQTLDTETLYTLLCTWLRTVDPYGFEFELDRDAVTTFMGTGRQWRYPPIESE